MDLLNHDTLEALEARIRTVLPEQYQDRYDDVQPVSMGSARVRYEQDGSVAWDEMWGSFCDLAMAGGPPHKGKLLEPASETEILAAPQRYQDVVAEICRGFTLVSHLPAAASENPGWVRVQCSDQGMAGWLLRAIVMENISVRCDGATLELPAGPNFRLEKEIKNVITSIAKTCHYWTEHMRPAQHLEIRNLFATMSADMPLLQPGFQTPTTNAGQQQELALRVGQQIQTATKLPPVECAYYGWLGLECLTVRSAIWLMRALVASNVLARREDRTLFVPVNSTSDPQGEIIVQRVTRVFGFAKSREVV